MSSSQANAKMKRFTLRGVLDGLRSSVSAPTKSDTEIEESLRSEHFHISKTVRHGFPYQPTAVAFDPVQHILAIGNKTGSLRIIGRPGVDIHITHDGEVAILQVLFLDNEGALVTVCSDDTLHLWNYRQKKPEIVHSLKFQRERITRCHLPFQSKWLYIGTERGNVHIVNIESFILSGYVINWNKAIELSRKTHPGPVVHLSDNPVDTNKLLVGFESGAIVMWDLRSKSAEYRYNSPEALRSIAWHHEGKQFMCSHSDGSLTTWNTKTPHKAVSVLMPHAKLGAEGKPDPCKPIAKVAWKSVRNSEDIVIFSGGMSYDRAGRTPIITVMTGKSTTVLEMEHNVIDFVVLCETPWCHDFQDPYAIVVLLQNDLVVVDLTSPGYPCFENPYPMDLHESPVTACQYYANCPTDLIPAFYSVGSRQKKSLFSEKSWPIKGGQWGTTTVSYPEIMITGHADGSLKFWDASSVSLQILYKIKTAKIFEKAKRSGEGQDEDPFAIQMIFLCPESRMLLVAGATHAMLFKFCRQEVSMEVSSLEFSIVYEIFDEMDSPEFEYPTLAKPSLAVVAQHSSSMGSYSSNTSDNKTEQMTAVKVRSGSRKWAAGFQADLVCILCYVEGEPPANITVMSLNSSYGLMAFGNESGLAIVDFIQKTCLLNLGTPDLYGSMDPYQRAPRSPRSKKSQPEGPLPGPEEGKSPTTDQLPCVQSTVSKVPPPPIPPPRPKHKRAQQLTSIEETKAPAATPAAASSREEPSLLKPASLMLRVPSVEEKDDTKKKTEEEKEKEKEKEKSKKEEESSSSSSCSRQEEEEEDEEEEVFAANSSGGDSSDNNNGSSSTLIVVGDSNNNPQLNLQSPEDKAEFSAGGEGGGGGGETTPTAEERAPSPLLLNVGTCSSASHKSSSTGSVNLEGLTVKTPLCKTLSDQGTTTTTTTKAPPPPSKGKPNLRRSLSDADMQDRDQNHALKSTSVLSRLRKRSSRYKQKDKASSEVAADPASLPSAGTLTDVSSSSSGQGADLELAQEASVLDNDAASAAADPQKVLSPADGGDPKSGGGGEVLVEQGGPNSKSFFRRVSVKLKSSFAGKTKGEEDAELRYYRERVKSMREKKVEVIDLSEDGNSKKPSVRKVSVLEICGTRRTDRNDGSSFSRSRSSSISSLDNVTKEAIQCLVFADSYTRKTDNLTCPCLWVGTSLGSVIVINLNLPGLNGEQRTDQPVIVSPSGTIFRLKGAITAMSFLDCNGILIQSVFDQWRDGSGGGSEGGGGGGGGGGGRGGAGDRSSVYGGVSERGGSSTNLVNYGRESEKRDNRDDKVSKASRQMSVSTKPKISPTSSQELTDRQFVIICSEKQARVMSLPSQTCAYKVKITETSFVVRAEIVSLRDSVCLMCYIANGHIMAFSLPSLKPLYDDDFLPLTDYRVARTFCFSNSGHALYLCSPTEVQKITYSADIAENLSEMLGDLFLPCDTPEAPKQGFFKNLFGGGTTNLDREELFGESSGKASKGLAKHIPGAGGMQNLQQQAGAVGGEFARTRQLVTERGEKLGDLDDASARMMNQAETFSSAAHSVMLKYRDRKWYQF